MKVLDLLKGKKVKVMTDAKVPVELEIKKVEQEHHSQDIGEATRENDWWPESREWTTVKVIFTNGFTKTYDRFDDIEIVEP